MRPERDLNAFAELGAFEQFLVDTCNHVHRMTAIVTAFNREEERGRGVGERRRQHVTRVQVVQRIEDLRHLAMEALIIVKAGSQPLLK